MATIKAILKKDKKKDGTYPLVIRITKDGRSTFVYTEYSLLKEQWDDKNQRVKKHPNSVRLNHLIAKRIAEAGDKAIELESNKQNVSSIAIKKLIDPKGGSTFFQQAEIYLESLRTQGKYNRYTADKPRIKHFKEYCEGYDMAFSDITIGMLERFKAWLKGGYLKLSERSAVNHWVVIRSVFSQAKKNHVIDEKCYPFGKGKISIKFPDSKKIGLTKEEIQKIEEIRLPEPYNHARNLWLLSYYFAGARISDIMRLKWSDFLDGRLYYTMNKNDKADSVKVPEKAVSILGQYKGKKDDTDFVFHDLRNIDLEDDFKVQRQIAFCTSRYDKFLKKHVAKPLGINKKLTMHIARHAFAQNATTIAARTLQKLFRHSDLKTTVGYMGHFDHKAADDALDAVLD
jgi:integrase